MSDPPAEPATEVATRPDHHGLGVEHPVEIPPKRSLFHRVIRLGVLLVALLVLVGVLAPMLLSTAPGTSLVTRLVSARIDGELHVRDLRLSWLKGQSIEGLYYTHAGAGLEAEVREVRLEALGLFDVLMGSRKLGEVRLVDVQVRYDQPVERGVRSDRPPRTEGSKQGPFALPPGLSGRLVIDGLSVAYTAPDQAPVTLSMPTGTLEMPGLRDISFDFGLAFAQGDKSGQLRLEGELLNLFDPDGHVQPMQAGYKVAGSVHGVPTQTLGRFLSGLDYSSPVFAYMFDKPGRFAEVFGYGEFHASVNVTGRIDQLAAELSVQTPQVKVALYQEREGDTLIASPRSSARLELSVEAFDALFPNSKLKLAEPTGLSLTTLEMRLPRSDDAFDWNTATAKLKLAADDNFALRDPQGELIGVDGLQIGGASESVAQAVQFDLSATLTAVDQQGVVTREPVKLDLIVRRPFDQDREIDFYSKTLPIKLADALGGQEGRLVIWLGDQLELQAEVRGKVVQNESGERVLVNTYALRPAGRVTGEIMGEFDTLRYSLATPDKSPIEAVLVPEAFASLMELVSGRPGKPALTISEPMPVYLTLGGTERGGVSVATDPSREGVGRFYFDPDQTYLGASIELTPATVYDPNRDASYELRGGTIKVLADDLRGKAELSAELKLWVRPDAGKEGIPALIAWQTTVTDLLDSEGALPLDGAALMQQLALSGGVKLDQAPSGLFDTLLNRDGDIASVLGPVVEQMDAKFTYADGKPIGATLRLNWDEQNNQPLPNAGASMRPAAFDINAQGMLSVRGGQDLELQVRVTEAFGDRWMGQLHPILFDAKTSDRPVTIKIDGDSFRFPLSDALMAGANVQAEIDLGSLEFGDDALLGRLLDWTDHAGDRAVFEPARVSMVDGRISYDELDLSVGNVKLRLDGEVDLASGQIVDMAVRVPGESLIRVFNELDGVIPADDYLSIPMAGPIRRPQFDRRLITQEVTRLIARGIVDRQRQDLRDKIRDEVGIEGEQPGGQFIDSALDLLFGGRKRPADD